MSPATPPVSWRTYLPLEGITLERALPEVAIGNFGLSRLKNEKHPQVAIESLKEDPSFHKICLSHLVTGKQPSESVELSLAILRDATALLRFYLYVSCQGQWPVMNLIDARALPAYGNIPAVSSTGEVYIAPFHPGLRDYSMRITKNAVSLWNRFHIEKVIRIMESKHLGIAVAEFDEVVVSSLIWCGEMLAEREIKECFLRGATALETISSKSAGQGKITKTFAEFGAGLVGIESSAIPFDAKKFPAKAIKGVFLEAKKHFLEAYRLRCHISHGSSQIGMNQDEEMWKSQRLFVSACVGALLLWEKVPKKDGFYKSLRTVVQKLGRP